MAFTDFYLAALAAASDLNAGAPLNGVDGGPVVTRTNCDATDVPLGGGDRYIEDKDGTGWGDTDVGYFLKWDTAGGAEMARVSELSVGGNDNIIRVVPVGSSFTNGVGKTVRVGGSFDTLDGALSSIEKTCRDADDNPPRINVQVGASPWTGDATVDFSGDEDSPITIEGYTTTPGDGGEAECQLTYTCHQSYVRTIGIYFNRAAIGDAHAIEASGDKLLFERVRARSSGTGKHSFNLTGANFVGLLRCVSEGSGEVGFLLGNVTWVFGCIARNAGTYGFRFTLNTWLQHCIIHDAAGHGAYASGAYQTVIDGCTFYNNGGSGFYRDTAAANKALFVTNSIFYGNGGYGIGQDASDIAVLRNNAFGSNSSGECGNVRDDWRSGDIQDIADPFVNKAGGDFRIDPRTEAGQQLLRAGFPASLDDDNPCYLDVGALPADLVMGRGLMTGGGH